MIYHIVSETGVIVFSNLNSSCLSCSSDCTVLSQSIDKCVLSCAKKRYGKTNKGKATIFICSDDSVHVASSRRFKEKLELYADLLDEISAIKVTTVDAINKNVKRLLHNLTSLNAHNIQELYALVPQNILAENLRSQISIINDFVSKDPKETALAFLRLTKINASMKNEFSVFRKLYESSPTLQHKYHKIHKVCLNVLYIFFQDFTDNKVHVNVDPTEANVYIDYESFCVALYHLFDNATKYVQPDSRLSVSFNKTKDNYIISLDMMSFKIFDYEIDQLTTEGYFGKYAKMTDKAGDGIGMSLVLKLLELNNASIKIRHNIRPAKSFALNGVEYDNNQFEIVIPNKYVN